MTTNLHRGKTRNVLRGATAKAVGAGADLGLAIGENDIEYFSCPGCSRPLARGVMRCPGCGAAMIMGVRFKRAGVLMVLGIVLGLAIGGVITTSVIGSLLREPKPVAAIAPVPPLPVASAAAASSLPGQLPVHATPPAAVSALSGTAVVNGRIAVDTVTLSGTLADRNASSVEIARAFRSLAADAALGIDVAGRLASWPEAATVKADLETFYLAMADAARSALRAPYSDTAGYRASAAAMMPVLAKLGAVDAVSRTLATTIDLELPPVALAP
jgi:predicted lysophospholipase L1 biosynthesis ABC-type transport system permease subunit